MSDKTQLFYDGEHLLQVDLKTLEEEYRNGNELALDKCVIKCYLEVIEHPEWVTDALMLRSQKNLNMHAEKVHKKQKFHALVIAAIKAIEDTNIATGDARYSIAEVLLINSNFRTKNGYEYSVENIEKIWNRTQKQGDHLAHAAAYWVFRERLERLPENIDSTKIEQLIAEMEPVNLLY